MYFIGIDIGSAYTKAVLIDQEGRFLAGHLRKTGIQFEVSAKSVCKQVLKKAGLTPTQVTNIGATGVGRTTCPMACLIKPEINCIAKGCFHEFPHQSVLIDIGGQDNKIIRLDGAGRQVYFKMNRKCAAGTGSFLEDISRKLNISLKKMNLLAQAATESVEIGSYCTVFAATEIIHHLRAGKELGSILRGIFASVVKRVLEMDPIEEIAILSGGVVANNPVIVEIFQKQLAHGAKIPPNPQLIGALGAALYARSQ